MSMCTWNHKYYINLANTAMHFTLQPLWNANSFGVAQKHLVGLTSPIQDMPYSINIFTFSLSRKTLVIYIKTWPLISYILSKQSYNQYE
jgi:hypothetical protein